MPAKGSEEEDMLLLTAAVSAFLFVYLFTALIRPEWF
jgi:K+-transporting ATPase KdpF subunit